VDCRKEAVAAIKYEGPNSFETSFQTLGEVASRGLMNNPQVQNGMAALGSDIDKQKFEELAKEAGLSAPATHNK
jgi:hypothetical protein